MIRSRDQLEAHIRAGGQLRYELRAENHASCAKWAVETGLVKPMADGLFPDTTQTFAPA